LRRAISFLSSLTAASAVDRPGPGWLESAIRTHVLALNRLGPHENARARALSSGSFDFSVAPYRNVDTAPGPAWGHQQLRRSADRTLTSVGIPKGQPGAAGGSHHQLAERSHPTREEVVAVRASHSGPQPGPLGGLDSPSGLSALLLKHEPVMLE
jgi:hypothetical protein